MKTSLFYVSRQLPYYQHGHQQVEVAQGGLDYSGSDALVVEYRKLGEGEEFTGMRPAVDAAIAIARQWRKDSGKRVFIATGCTHGMFTELEGHPFTEKLGKQLQAEADKFDANLPHCDRCGELLGAESFTLTDYGDEFRFCREYCAEEFLRAEYAANEAKDALGE